MLNAPSCYVDPDAGDRLIQFFKDHIWVVVVCLSIGCILIWGIDYTLPCLSKDENLNGKEDISQEKIITSTEEGKA